MLTQEARLRGAQAAKDAPRLNPMERAKANPKNKRLAIYAYCWDCQGGDADPGVRERIRECSRVQCPLYAHRPHQA